MASAPIFILPRFRYACGCMAYTPPARIVPPMPHEAELDPKTLAGPYQNLITNRASVPLESGPIEEAVAESADWTRGVGYATLASLECCS